MNQQKSSDDQAHTFRESRAINLRDDFLDDAQPLWEPDPGLLGQLENWVRKAYMQCAQDRLKDPSYGRTPIPMWDGGEDQFGNRCQSQWMNLVRTLLTVEAEPLRYIDAQFAQATSHQPPRPSQLCSAAALAAWEPYGRHGESQVHRQLVADEAALRIAITPIVVELGWEEDRAIRYCLNSTAMVTVTTLFRYCLASRKSFQSIKDRFRESAFLHYLFPQSAYDKTWSEYIPVEFQQAAFALRAHLIGKP